MTPHIANVLDTHGVKIDNTIKNKHFGSGYEFNRYDNTHPSEQYKFTEILDRLNVTYLRYPGGTQTENYFDPANPDDPVVPKVGETTTDTKYNSVTPISEFIQIANDYNAKVLIVLPTWRYFDEATRKIKPAAENIIKDFVTDLLEGVYGAVDVYAFEIGNEWFQDIFGWTAAEFGEVQSKIALWVREAIDAANTSDDPKIYVQSSGSGDRDDDENGIRDNIEIFAQFSAAEQAAVDGVVDHFYYPTKPDDNDEDGDIDALDYTHTPADRINRIFDEMNWGANEDDLEIVTTEWNIRADVVNEITGFELLPLVVGHFAEMIRNGLDFATFWTTQALGDSDGSLSQKHEDTLTPTGLLFRMMHDALVGTKVVDPSGNQKREASDYIFTSEDGVDLGYTYTFKGNGKVVVYVASAINEDIDISNLVQDLMSQQNYGNHHAHATKIVAIGPDATDEKVDGKIVALNAADLASSVMLKPNELIQIEFTSGAGVDLMGDDQTNTKDELIGTDFADSLIGHGGNDTLIGENGKDTLDGGAGNDSLRGHNGDDDLSGGAGSDSLSAGSGSDKVRGHEGSDKLWGASGADDLSGNEGKDSLYGADQSDLLEGGQGDDLLDGGSGDDTLKGGQGDDVADGKSGNDSVTGGAGDDSLIGSSGQDTLLGGEDNDTLRGGEGHDSLTGETGDDVLYGGDNRDTLKGSGGSDTLRGDGGNDLLFGGSGQDIFDFNEGWGDDTISDFDPSLSGEKIDLSDVTDFINFQDLENNHMTEVSGNTVIMDNTGNTITLLNVSISDLQAGDFLF